MAVFTALRNKARSTASGFLVKTAKNALGLNRAEGLRFPSPSGSPRPQGTVFGTGDVLQYPLDLGTDGNSHFIAFFAKEMKSPKISLGTNNEIASTIEAIQEEKKFSEILRSQRSGQRGSGTVNSEATAASDKRLLELNKKLGKKFKASTMNSKGKSIREMITSPGSIKTVKTIALYFPPSVQQSYELKYNDQQISPQAAFGASVISAFINQGMTTGAVSSIMDPIKDLVMSMVNRSALGALDAVAPGASTFYNLNRGKVFAPKMEVMFEGIGKRSFSYSFVFTPSSEDEAAEVQRIIKAFRFHAAADFASETNAFGFELTIPDVFDIVYYTNNNQENGYLHKIGTCSLEKVDVTYGGDKMTWHPTTSEGASPTKITMALNFRELRTITKAAIDDGF